MDDNVGTPASAGHNFCMDALLNLANREDGLRRLDVVPRAYAG